MSDENKISETEAEIAETAPEGEMLELEGDAVAAALAAEVEELRAQLLYAQAEMQNVRRRLEKEKADATAYAATGFARDMLSVADNFARALQALPDDLKEDEKLKPLVTGIEMTARELDSVFQRHGVTKIEALGAALDPNKHQAMIELPTADAAPGTIVQEMQAGYMIKERLLRPSMVAVAKAVEA